jgi:hypothetical protein
MNAKSLKPNPVWIVVQVDSGVPTEAEVFDEMKPAKRRASYLRRDADPNDDVVAVFPATIKTKPAARRADGN